MSRLEHMAEQLLERGGGEAERALQEALRRALDPAELRKVAERFYAEPEVSVPAFKRLLELIPDDLDVLVELGFVYFLMGEDAEAQRQLERARALNPEHVRVLTLEAALSRDPKEKILLYRRILEKEPGNEVARRKLQELGRHS